MFYYPNVLNYRTGCFATIWLAATKGRKITRRDLLRVNVHRTCNDIIDFVLVRVLPLVPGLPRPRFSLYLSSQLQYGVILVYHRQCELLLEEIQHTIDRLLRSHEQKRIDIPEEDSRLKHTTADALILFDETEGARDPFFGLMDFGYGIPSPNTLMQMALPMGEASPEQPTSVASPLDGITASQESITMAEREPIAIPQPEFEEVELQAFDMTDILLEQPDDILEGEEERPRERRRDREREKSKERERRRESDLETEQERAAEVERTRELTVSVISTELQATTLPSGEPLLLPEKDLKLVTEGREPAERERTPTPVPLPMPATPPSRAEDTEWEIEQERLRERRTESPSLELQDIAEAPETQRRKRRRRQLLFIDEETQISREELDSQIKDVQMETRRLMDVLVKPPSDRRDPQDLLTNPCTELSSEVLELWRQGAIITPFTPAPPRRRISTVEEERGREREPLEEEVEREISVKEIPRELVESGSFQPDISAPSTVVLEVSEKDISGLDTPVIRGSPLPVLRLEDVPEERMQPVEPVMEDIVMDVEDFLRHLADVTDEEEVTFYSLLPQVVTRRIVALAFWGLLERIEAKEVSVRQEAPYADIIISKTQRR